tara:strand:+ start:44 stop:157 length:114 start_codon:yes stop_codon:yes gene_type:complete
MPTQIRIGNVTPASFVIGEEVVAEVYMGSELVWNGTP